MFLKKALVIHRILLLQILIKVIDRDGVVINLWILLKMLIQIDFIYIYIYLYIIYIYLYIN
jgi:hypothetical protein